MRLNRVILIPDSFKGTLSSAEVCAVLHERLLEYFPGCEAVSVPVADGGEGSVDAFLAAMGGKKILCRAENPFFEPTEAFYGLLGDGRTAVMEMAACAGLPLAGGRADPRVTTTFGVGRLLLAAAAQGCGKIILGLGGSATNDGGCGAAAACGIKFFDAAGREYVPTGGTLSELSRIDASGLAPSLRGVELVAMCDIDNPAFGLQGAARVFSPQKGASPAVAEELDEGVRRLCEVIRRDLGRDVSQIPGGGAAGAMGAGMAAFFGARLQMGIEAVLDAVGFDAMARNADLIVTGEGKLDGQSLRGKAVIGVARRAKKLGVPVVAVVGGAAEDAEDVYAQGVTAVFPTNRLPQDFSVSRANAGENLAFTADNLFRLLKRMS